MDRFIVPFIIYNTPLFCDLKSNMDRFIAYTTAGALVNVTIFKIQYG